MSKSLRLTLNKCKNLIYKILFSVKFCSLFSDIIDGSVGIINLELFGDEPLTMTITVLLFDGVWIGCIGISCGTDLIAIGWYFFLVLS